MSLDCPVMFLCIWEVSAMNITAKQSYVLTNLHRIVVRHTARGRLMPYLDGKKCGAQINSLAAKGLVGLNRYGRPTKAGEPSCIVGSRWVKAEDA